MQHWANGSSSAAAVQICLLNTTTKGDECLAEICDASHLEPLECSDDAADAGRPCLMRRALLALSSSSWLAKSGWEPAVVAVVWKQLPGAVDRAPCRTDV